MLHEIAFHVRDANIPLYLETGSPMNVAYFEKNGWIATSHSVRTAAATIASSHLPQRNPRLNTR
jgi:hypothetical protein